MSNFICPECGMTNIDCGGAGYKTPRELELEKELNLYKRAIERTDRIEKCLNQEGQIKRLEDQLRIATKALKDVIKDYDINGPCEEDCVGYYMYHIARKALKEMEGVK